MEAVLYEHQIPQRSLRLARLKVAMGAFLSEPATARELRTLTLFVTIPAPSQVEKMVPKKSLLLRRRVNDRTTNSRRAGKRQSGGAKEKGSSAKRATRYTRLRARLFARKHTRQVAVQHCTIAAFCRLKQATRDAAALTQWLRVPDTESSNPAAACSPSSLAPTSLPRCHGRNLSVTVAAVLAPRTIADLSLFTAWQLTPRDAQRCFSPLRSADSIVLNVGGGSETVEVIRQNVKDSDGNGSSTAMSKKRRGNQGNANEQKVLKKNVGGFVNRKVTTYTSFLVDWEEHGSPQINLGALLLPHQSILLDITWCLHAGMTKYVGRRGQKRTRQRRETKEETVSKTVLDLHTFVDSFQGKLKLPKESRVACWLSYHGGDSASARSTSAASGGNGNGSDNDDSDDLEHGDAGPLLFTQFTGISGNAPQTMHFDVQAQPGRGQRRPAALPAKEQKVLTRKRFAHLHMEFSQLYRQLFHGRNASGSSGSGAPASSARSLGQNTDWTLLSGYGGAIAHLVDSTNMVALPALPVTVSPNASGRLKKVTLVGKTKRAAGSTARGNAMKPLEFHPSSAALLLTRGQRDLYSYLSFLLGQEKLDLYSRALCFLRTQLQRLSRAARFASRFSPPKTVLLVEKPLEKRRVHKKESTKAPMELRGAEKRARKKRRKAARKGKSSLGRQTASPAASARARPKAKVILEPQNAKSGTRPGKAQCQVTKAKKTKKGNLESSATQRFIDELLGATAAARKEFLQPPRKRNRRAMRVEKHRRHRINKKAKKQAAKKAAQESCRTGGASKAPQTAVVIAQKSRRDGSIISANPSTVKQASSRGASTSTSAPAQSAPPVAKEHNAKETGGSGDNELGGFLGWTVDV